MSGCGCEIEVKDREQRGVLMVLLSINALMFVIEFAAGWLSQSSALLADSLDMLADALVYAISFYAIGKAEALKTHAARLSGWLQIALGAGVMLDILRRLILGSEPQSLLMMGVGVLALIANVICLSLIAKHRNGDIHMRASWIFSANDVIANLGVIIGGGLVYWLGMRWPDLIIGTAIAMLVTYGGIRILRETRAAAALDARGSSCCNS